MALPSSGQISMSQINSELGRSSTANISLDTAENGGYAAINTCSPSHPDSGNPATMNEWHGYNHTINCCGGATCYTHSGYSFDTSCSAACSGSFTNTYYSCCSTLGVGCRLYTGACTFNTGTTFSGYISNGTNCYTVNGGTIDAVSACSGTTTTTTSSGAVCHDFQATATSYMTWTDCCGTPQSAYLLVGDTFCAQVGTVSGFYIDLGTNCNC